MALLYCFSNDLCGVGDAKFTRRFTSKPLRPRSPNIYSVFVSRCFPHVKPKPSIQRFAMVYSFRSNPCSRLPLP